MSEQVVIGIDGGGTTTRVLAADLSGEVVGTAETDGANPQHNERSRARDDVRTGIESALAEAGRDQSDVAELTAGFAGLNDESGREWAQSFVDVPGLDCEPVCVNDAVVAHAGALPGEPGIVAICGTGCIVFGVTEDGTETRNYDLNHYARATARHVTSRAVHQILIDNVAPADSAFVADLFAEWGVDSVRDLRRAIRSDDRFDTSESGNALDSAAPLVTAAASSGAPIAQRACDESLAEVVTGIRAVGSYFDTEPVAVAPTGSVLGSEYMANGLRERLDDGTDRYRVAEAELSPVGGAVFDSLERAVENANESVVDRLRAHPAAQP